jgi:hypothetical protein
MQASGLRNGEEASVSASTREPLLRTTFECVDEDGQDACSELCK